MEDVPSSNLPWKFRECESLGGPIDCKKEVAKIKLEIKPFYFVIIVLTVLALLILKPFISTILTAIVLSYLSHPVYRWFLKKFNSKTLSALATTFLLVLVITIPTVFAVNALSKEIFAGYLLAKQYLSTGFSTLSCNGNFLCSFFDILGLSEPNVRNFISDTLGKVTGTMFNTLSSYVISLPKIMANLFVAVFLTYYLLKDGGKLAGYAKSVIPIKQVHLNTLLRRFNEVTYAVVYGNVIVALVQGTLTSLGFFLFGVASPLIWGIVTAFTSLIPFLGAVVVWLPAAIFLIVAGFSSGDGPTLLRGFGLLIYGFLFISSIDNIMKPRLIGGRANLHPALVLLGVLGGLSALGIIGLIIGPVLIALAATIISMASKTRMKVA